MQQIAMMAMLLLAPGGVATWRLQGTEGWDLTEFQHNHLETHAERPHNAASLAQLCNVSLPQERQAIAAATRASEALNVSVQQATSRVSQLAGEIAEHYSDVAGWQAQREAAAEARAAQEANYTALQSNFSEAVNALRRAIEAVKVQDYAGARASLAWIGTVQSIPGDAKRLWHELRSGINSELHHNTTISLFEGLAKKLQSELADAGRQEASSKQAHSRFIRHLAAQVEQGKKYVETKTGLQVKILEDKAKDARALAESTRATKAHVNRMSDLADACAQQAGDLDARASAIHGATGIAAGLQAAGKTQEERPASMQGGSGNLSTAKTFLGQALSVNVFEVLRPDHLAPEHNIDPRWSGPLAYLNGWLLTSTHDVKDIPDYQKEIYFRPVSVTVICIVWLTLLDLFVHTALSIARNRSELRGESQDKWYVHMLDAMAQGMMLSSVMSMLFLSARMFVLAVTHGKGEPWALLKAGEIVTTAGVTLQMVTLFIFGVSGHPGVAKEANKDKLRPKVPAILDGRCPALAWQFCIATCVLGGLAVVLICTILPMLLHGLDNVSVSLQSTTVLITAYLCVEIGIWLTENISRCGVGMQSGWAPASEIMEKVPMLVVLLLANRMRFLQFYPPDGTPPLFFRVCIRVIAASVLAELVVYACLGRPAVAAPGDVPEAGALPPKRRQPLLQHFVAFAGWAATISLVTYSCCLSLVVPGPPMSPTVFCVLSLCCLFLAVHFLSWMVAARGDLCRTDMPVVRKTLTVAKTAVHLCPQLSVLFLAARLRALQITHNEGAPQWWEQDCLGFCVCAIGVQAVCCIVLPLFTGDPPTLGPDGRVLYEMQPVLVAYLVQAIKYTSLLCIIAGFAGVSLAIFTMTPESATAGRVDDAEFFKSIGRSILQVFGFFILASVVSSAKAAGLVVKIALETLDSTLLGTELVCSNVTIDAIAGYVYVHGLVVFNPEGMGFHSEHLLAVHLLRLKINTLLMARTLGKQFEITELAVEGVSLNYETLASGSNVNHVLNHMEEMGIGNPEHLEKIKKLLHDTGIDKYLPDPKVDVKRLRINDVNAKLVTKGFINGACITLQDADITDLQLHGSGAKRAVGFIVSFVMKTILKSALSSSNIMKTMRASTSRAMGRTAGKLCAICNTPKGGRPSLQDERRPNPTARAVEEGATAV